jgi:eukaryotic-like serine/threonine-protein kinase
VSEGSPTEQFGPYLVYEQLGVGGMAQVHRAIHASSGLQRPVALKRMLSHIAGNQDMVKSFVREARLAKYLCHQNVAQTYELGRVGDTYFIAMELVTGRNLREVLRHCGVTTGPMPVPIALNILNQICDALDYAHNLCDETGQPLGIVHRDVSPSNVIVSASGQAKLIDFGIAKASGGGMQTMSGTLKGKFAYMAPEYIGGRLDARADLFAVGVIAHELLTNRPLFSGRDDIDTLTRVREMKLAPPSKKNSLVPPEIDDVVMTALARDPDRRWQHATALRTAMTTLTRRLGLIASNAQVVQWLDWAFSHQPKRTSRAETDTQLDAEPITLDPSISIEPGTVDLSGSSQRMTVIKPSGGIEPPVQAPAGTPARLRAQRSSSVPVAAAPSAAAKAVQADRRHTMAPSGRTRSASNPPPVAAAAATARARSPSNAPPIAAPVPALSSARVPSASSPPPVQGSQAIPTPLAPGQGLNVPLRTGGKTFLSTPSPLPQSQQLPSPLSVQGSQALPPMAAMALPPGGKTFLSSPAPAPSSPPASSVPAGVPTGVSTAVPTAVPTGVATGQSPSPYGAAATGVGSGAHSLPAPLIPPRNAAPFGAPRPSAQAPIALSSDPARSAMAARDFAQRSPISPANAHLERGERSERRAGGPVLTVVLVILAAAVAAITVYLVLPLLT